MASPVVAAAPTVSAVGAVHTELGAPGMGATVAPMSKVPPTPAVVELTETKIVWEAVVRLSYVWARGAAPLALVVYVVAAQEPSTRTTWLTGVPPVGVTVMEARSPAATTSE